MLDRRSLLLALAGSAMLPSPASHAADLATPQGDVLLTVTGAIERTNASGKALFDRAMLEALGTEDLVTSTAWTDGAPRFTGVRFSTLLDAVGATGTKVVAKAINDYAVELDVEELRRYPVLLAMQQDGKTLRVRDKGPIWVVYPRDQFAELADEADNTKWIWQLVAIDLQ